MPYRILKHTLESATARNSHISGAMCIEKGLQFPPRWCSALRGAVRGVLEVPGRRLLNSGDCWKLKTVSMQQDELIYVCAHTPMPRLDPGLQKQIREVSPNKSRNTVHISDPCVVFSSIRMFRAAIYLRSTASPLVDH